MDINDARSLITVLAFATFIGIVIWAYGRGRKAAFDEAAALPLVSLTALQAFGDAGQADLLALARSLLPPGLDADVTSLLRSAADASPGTPLVHCLCRAP